MSRWWEGQWGGRSGPWKATRPLDRATSPFMAEIAAVLIDVDAIVSSKETLLVPPEKRAQRFTVNDDATTAKSCPVNYLWPSDAIVRLAWTSPADGRSFID